MPILNSFSFKEVLNSDRLGGPTTTTMLFEGRACCLYKTHRSILSPSSQLFSAFGSYIDLRVVPQEVYFFCFPSNAQLWRGLNLVSFVLNLVSFSLNLVSFSLNLVSEKTPIDSSEQKSQILCSELFLKSPSSPDPATYFSPAEVFAELGWVQMLKAKRVLKGLVKPGPCLLSSSGEERGGQDGACVAVQQWTMAHADTRTQCASMQVFERAWM